MRDRGTWNLREILELSRARVLVFLREPEAIFWVFVFPMLLSAVLGYAFRQGAPQPNRVVVAAGQGADELAATLRAVPLLEVEVAADDADLARRLLSGAIDAVVTPAPTPQVRLNPERPEAETARLRVLHALAERDLPVGERIQLQPVTEAGSRYVDFLFPGLLGMNLMGTGLWGVGFAIADHRQKKLLKRFLVTPMRRSSFLLGFILSRFVFLVLEVVALALFGRFALGVPMRGSIAVFAGVSVLGALSFAGLGILVASRARTLEGASGIMNLVMMPMWLCSGVFFSYERFPEVLHPLLKALPLTALNDGLRAVMLDGEPLAGLGGEFLVLVAWGAVSFFVALKLFRWE